MITWHYETMNELTLSYRRLPERKRNISRTQIALRSCYGCSLLFQFQSFCYQLWKEDIWITNCKWLTANGNGLFYRNNFPRDTVKKPVSTTWLQTEIRKRVSQSSAKYSNDMFRSLITKPGESFLHPWRRGTWDNRQSVNFPTAIWLYNTSERMY